MNTTTKQNWITLSTIQIGGAICLPMILIGFELSKTNSLMGCLFSIAIANSILFALGMIASKMSVSFKKTTGQLAVSYFGLFGRFLFAGVLFISMCGWFSIQTEIMVQDVSQLINCFDPLYGIIILSLFIGVINVFGISSIARFSNATVPLMIATLVIVVASNFSLKNDLFTEKTNYVQTTALSLLLSSCIACIFDFPTYFRHAKDKKEAYKATGIIFFVGIPLIEILGVLIGKTTLEQSLIEALSAVKMPFWNIWIFLFILLCGLSTNTANLYSAVKGLQCIFTGLSEQKATLVAVIFCIGLSFLKITSHLTLFLEVIGTFIASQSACMLILFLMEEKVPKKTHVMFSFFAGTMLGLIGIFYPEKSLIVPLIDAIIISGITLVLLRNIHTYKKVVIRE